MGKSFTLKCLPLLLLAACFFYLLGCEEKAEPKQQQYPLIQTNAATDADSTGVTFHGETLKAGIDEVTGYGFVWSTSAKPTLDDFHLALGTTLPSKFSARVTFDLLPKTQYFVRAYAVTKDNVIYADDELFTSLGSATPVIHSFSPKTATDGDTLIIVGKNFGSTPSSNAVVIGPNATAKVLSCSNDTITIVIPATPEAGPYKVSVTSNKRSAMSADNLVIAAPQITSIRPVRGKDGALVTVAGNYFSSTLDFNKVTLETAACQVLQSSSHQMKIYIPYSQFSGPVRIWASVNGKNSVAFENFFVEGPYIADVRPRQASFNDVITLTGEGFSTTPSANTVLFGTLKATVVTATNKQLTVVVPALPGDSVKISVRKDNKTNTYVHSFIANNPWHLVSNATVPTQERGAATGFSIGNRGFIMLGQISDYDLYDPGRKIYNDVWEYNATTSAWTSRPNFPGGSRYYATAFTIGSKAYVGSGLDQNENLMSDFYAYDADLNTWKQIASMPGTGRNSAVAFSIGEKGYVGLGDGQYVGNSPYKSDFFEYNPTTNTWKQFNGPGPASANDFAFSVNNRGFVVIDGKQLWELLPATNTWVRRADYPDTPTFGAFAFTMNGKAYAGSGFYSAGYNLIYSRNFYSYDPDTNQWTTLEGFDYLKRFTGVAWGLNGKGYVLTGQSNAIAGDDWPYDYLNDLWVYDKP